MLIMEMYMPAPRLKRETERKNDAKSKKRKSDGKDERPEHCHLTRKKVQAAISRNVVIGEEEKSSTTAGSTKEPNSSQPGTDTS
jgi:hypothetical protein